jgi:hypothetical protein
VIRKRRLESFKKTRALALKILFKIWKNINEITMHQRMAFVCCKCHKFASQLVVVVFVG